MEIDSRTQLGEIGIQLDALEFPIVLNGGLVVPSRPSVSLSTLGGVQLYAEKSSRPTPSGASEARWQQPQSGTRATLAAGSPSGGARAPGTASPFALCAADDKLYPRLSEVGVAYPGTMIYRQEEGFWLRLESLLLPGKGRKAVFVVAVMPRIRQVSAWGYWHGGCIGVSWIGPRHTNYPDGSVCAFDGTDGSWQYGDDFVKLLDFYTVWAVRHLHLEWFGRWPGPQASANPVERITEFRGGELCGCSAPRGTYESCCKQHDMAEVTPRAVLSFMLLSQNRHRYPPTDITAFAASGSNPPKLRVCVATT